MLTDGDFKNKIEKKNYHQTINQAPINYMFLTVLINFTNDKSHIKRMFFG